MKLTHIFVLSLFSMILLWGCQQEEVAPLGIITAPKDASLSKGEFKPVSKPSIPPDEVIRTDYKGATKWRITYNNPGAYNPHRQNYFSTITGNFYTQDEVNSSDLTSNLVDIYIKYHEGTIMSPYFSGAGIVDTRLKPSNITPKSLALMTELYPEQFKSRYAEAYLYTQSSLHLEPGDVILFDTERYSDLYTNRYGAIHMVEAPSDYSQEGGKLVLEIIIENM